MPFKKVLSAFGVGGPRVDTVIIPPTARPGQQVTGYVNLLGGNADATIQHVTLSVVTRVEEEVGDREVESEVEFHRHEVARTMKLPAGQQMSIPFAVTLPWETPITAVFGQQLQGMTIGVRTELAIARAIDQGDVDAVHIEALPAQEAILEAMPRLGFRFKNADVERGQIRGAQQMLPFYQEIEFYTAPQYAHACAGVEVTFVTSEAHVDVILEVDKRGGLFSGGQDVYHTLRVPHVGFEQTDWAQVIDAWFQQSVLSSTAAQGLYIPAQEYAQPPSSGGR